MIYRAKVRITGREVAPPNRSLYRPGMYVGVSDYLYSWLRWACCFDGWQDISRETRVQ
jgi:hypothetical protein